MGDVPIYELQDCLHYDPVTGLLHWKRCWYKTRQWNNKNAGKRAFTAISGKGYHHGSYKGQTLKASRVAWAIYYGKWPKGDVDHKDGVRTNDKILNLRDIGRPENKLNCKLSEANTSGYSGVNLTKSGMFMARVTVDGLRKSIGTFTKPEDAYAARVAFYKTAGMAIIDRRLT